MSHALELVEIHDPEYLVIEAPGDVQVLELAVDSIDLIEVAEQGPSGPPGTQGAAGAAGPRGLPGITVAALPPDDPQVNDLWLDIS